MFLLGTLVHSGDFGDLNPQGVRTRDNTAPRLGDFTKVGVNHGDILPRFPTSLLDYSTVDVYVETGSPVGTVSARKGIDIFPLLSRTGSTRHWCLVFPYLVVCVTDVVSNHLSSK